MSEENVGPAETEEQARKWGWKPKDEWNGSDDNWVDAEEFVARSDNRVLRERLTRAEQRAAKLDTQMADQARTIDEFRGWRDKVEENATKRALAELQAKQRQAMQDENQEAFDAAGKEIEKVVDEATKPQEQPKQQQDDPNFAPWAAKNPWYGDNIRMTDYAERIAPLAGKKHPGAGPEFYEAISEAVREEFPDYFENPNRKKAATVEGGGGTASRKRSKGYDDLPKDAKDACDRFVDQGIMSKEDYVKEYEWED